MGAGTGTPKSDWRRSPLSREQLARFNRRSDLTGLLQTGGIVDPRKLYGTVKGKLRLSLGRARGEWESRLRRQLFGT